MPDNWRTERLTDVYEIGSGLSKPRSEFGFGHPFLSFKDVLDNYFVPTQLSALVNSTEKERTYCSIRRGDVFLTRTSETQPDLGMSCVALRDHPSATFNGFTKRLRPRSPQIVVPEYAAYYFRGPKFRQDVTAMSSLSTRASLNNEMLSRLTVILPPVKEQEVIAAVLKPLDDKISLCRRMNETLEAIARAIFKSWFVDFDPVRAKAEGRNPGLPKHIADLFPNDFDDSSIGPIPKGWSVLSLDQLARFLNGLALQKYPPTGDTSLPVIKISQLRAGHTTGADQASTGIAPNYVVDDGDILFSWSGSLECAYWAGGRGALNQHLFKVTSSTYPKWLCYLAVHQHLDSFRHIAAGKATTMGHIQRHHLTQAKVPVPPIPTLHAMSHVLSPILESTWQRSVQSRKLAAIRDALLPKLLSGEIRVSERQQRMEAMA